MAEIVIRARKASLSPVMQVNRLLPFRSRRMVGPFIFMDHAGPVKISPGAGASPDVLPHPHIGLSTVSYLFGGSVTHRDSLGMEQVISPGEVNWMTAGKGIAHSERFEDPRALAGGLEMIQTWVALPEKDEETAPSFRNYKQETLPQFSDRGVWWRLIAGEAYGEKSPVATHSPLVYLHAELEANASLALPAGYSERGVYVAGGSVEADGIRYDAGTLVVFGRAEQPALRSPGSSRLMVLGGEPLGERHIWWNFVSSRRERIEQAKEDWKQGRIVLPPNDNKEYIPLPDDRRKKPDGEAPAPEALS